MANKKQKDNLLLIFMMMIVLVALIVVGYKIMTLPDFQKVLKSKKQGRTGNRLSKKINDHAKTGGKRSSPEARSSKREKSSDNLSNETIFLPDFANGVLIESTREIPAHFSFSEKCRTLLREVCAHKAFSEEIRLKTIFVNSGIIYLDFNRFLLKGHRNGTLANMLKFYSIVNTVTQMKAGSGVIFLLEGQPIPLYQMFNFELPFYFNRQLLENSSETTPTGDDFQ